MSTTVTVTENTVAVTDSGGTAVVTVSSSPVTVTTSTSPFRHASTHGPAGTDPITALGNLTIGTATMTGGTATGMTINTATIGSAVMTAGTATSLALVTPTVGTATITGGTATNLSLVTPTIGTATMTGGTATSVTLGAATFSNAASFGSGSAGTPSVTFTGDTNTGIYSPGADQVAIATAGTAALTVNATQQVGIGPQAPTSRLHLSTDAAATQQQIDSGAATSALVFRRANTSLSAPAIIANGDNIGDIIFQGHDGSVGYRPAARIRGAVDAAPSASDMPGRLMFYTTADGSVTENERMRIDNAGLITGTGTSLGAWTAYTPTLGGTGWAIGNGTIDAAYCRVGKTVQVRISITFGTTTTAGVGALTLTAPFAIQGFPQFFAGAYDASAGSLYYNVGVNSSGNILPTVIGALGIASSYYVTANPFTWTTSDIIRIHGTYETSA